MLYTFRILYSRRNKGLFMFRLFRGDDSKEAILENGKKKYIKQDIGFSAQGKARNLYQEYFYRRHLPNVTLVFIFHVQFVFRKPCNFYGTRIQVEYHHTFSNYSVCITFFTSFFLFLVCNFSKVSSLDKPRSSEVEKSKIPRIERVFPKENKDETNGGRGWRGWRG